jgi:RNA polymerase sigma factor (sigma-70 family)
MGRRKAARDDSADRELIERIKALDMGAFDELFGKYRQDAMGLCFRILRDVEDSEEAMTDAFHNIWRKASQFKNTASVGSYIYAIVRNAALGRLRKRRAKERFVPCGGPEFLQEIENSNFGKADLMRQETSLERQFDLRRIIDAVREEFEMLDTEERKIAQFLLDDQLVASTATNLSVSCWKSRKLRLLRPIKEELFRRYSKASIFNRW